MGEWYQGDGLEDKWYIGDAKGNRGRASDDYAAAAKLINDWGCEGVQSAARLIGKEAAEGLLANHVRQNVREAHPGLDVEGTESTEELERKINRHRIQTIESKLTPEERKNVEKARSTLKKYGLQE